MLNKLFWTEIFSLQGKNFNILILSQTDLTIDAIAANTELTPCVDVRTGIGMDIEFSKKKWLPNPLDFLGNVDAD